MINKLLLTVTVLSLLLTTAAGPRDESIVLEGIGDTYVVADLAAPDDPQGLRDRNFGGLEFIKTWYVSQVQGQEQVYSIGLVKFDLSELKGKEIKSAHLQMFALRADLAQPVRLVDVSLAETNWNENEVNFKGIPAVSQQPIASTAVYGAGVWYSWDVSGAVARRAQEGAQVGFAFGLRQVEQKKEEQVVFATREVGRNAPRLVVTYSAPVSPILPSVPVLSSPIVVYVWQVIGVLLLLALVAAGAAGGYVLVSRRAARSALARPGLGAAAPVAAPGPASAANGERGEVKAGDGVLPSVRRR